MGVDLKINEKLKNKKKITLETVISCNNLSEYCIHLNTSKHIEWVGMLFCMVFSGRDSIDCKHLPFARVFPGISWNSCNNTQLRSDSSAWLLFIFGISMFPTGPFYTYSEVWRQCRMPLLIDFFIVISCYIAQLVLYYEL